MTTSLFTEFEDASIIDFPYNGGRIKILCKPKDFKVVQEMVSNFVENSVINTVRTSSVFSATKQENY